MFSQQLYNVLYKSVYQPLIQKVCYSVLALHRVKHETFILETFDFCW
jgi:hypothetical protein